VLPVQRRQATWLPEFWLFFGVVSLLVVPVLATLQLLGKARHSVARSDKATSDDTPNTADSSKMRLPKEPPAKAVLAGEQRRKKEINQ